VSDFRLQFDVSEIPGYAARYPARDDTEALAIAAAARERGHYTQAEFRRVCRWKRPRSAPLVARNASSRIRRQTGLALRAERVGDDDVDRMRALRELDGVNWATGSVLLHLPYPELYPILDVRVLDALGVRNRTSYGYEFWREFVGAYRELLARSGLDGRTVDRGLWEWSAAQSRASRDSR
jgi:hypothetical protein